MNLTDGEVLSSKCSAIFIDCERLDVVGIVSGQILSRRAGMTKSVGRRLSRLTLPSIYRLGGYRASGDALRRYSVCRNAVTLARRRCGCVRLLEAAGRRDRGSGLGWPCGVSCARVPR